MTNTRINAEYARKVSMAERMADDAWLLGGLDAMHAELASLRRLDADDVVIATVERCYHNQCMRVLPAQ
jgi:hypothetical protein